MPTEHPTYKNVSQPTDANESPHDDFVWDVRAENEPEVGSTNSDERANEPSVDEIPNLPPPSRPHNIPTSELLLRFPRPGPHTNQSRARSRRTSALTWVLRLLFAMASAAAAAWMVAGA